MNSLRENQVKTIAIGVVLIAVSGCKTPSSNGSPVPAQMKVENREQASKPAIAKNETPDQINEEIASLRKIIIPPEGVRKTDVDAVFGRPRKSKKLKGKGQKKMYPMHSYQLLPPKDGQAFRAFLYVTYRKGKVRYIGINHRVVWKNRVRYLTGSPGEIQQQRAIEAENVRVLADLIEIQKKFEDKLKDASWNR